jgi:hypothetical protein
MGAHSMAPDPVSAVASWLTPADNTDAELRSLFAEWIAAARHPDAISDEDESAHKAALTRINDAIDRIADLPATGIVGLAVKAYLCVRMAGRGTILDPVGIPDDEPDLEISTIEDVLRILPEAPQLVSMGHEPEGRSTTSTTNAAPMAKARLTPQGDTAVLPVASAASKRLMTDAEREVAELFKKYPPNRVVVCDR